MCNVQRMAKVNRFAYTIATNGEAIFWAAFDEAMNNSYIYRLEFSDVDDDSPVIVGETKGIVRLIVADCDYVYMAVTGDGIETIRKVHAVGNPEVAVDIASNLAAVNVNAMAVDQDYVYFSAMDNANNEIRAWRKSGEVRTVAKTVDRVTGMVRHGNFLYWADVGANQLPGQIKRAMIPDGSGTWTPETIRKNAGRPFGLAVDEMFVYWVDLNSMDGMRKLRKSPAVKAPPVELPDIPVAMINVNNASSFPANWLSVDGEYVYFIDNLANGAGTISRTRKQIMPAPTESLASMANSMVPFSAYSLITDAKRVYFAAPADPAAGSSVLWVAK